MRLITNEVEKDIEILNDAEYLVPEVDRLMVKLSTILPQQLDTKEILEDKMVAFSVLKDGIRKLAINVPYFIDVKQEEIDSVENLKEKVYDLISPFKKALLENKNTKDLDVRVYGDVDYSYAFAHDYRDYLQFFAQAEENKEPVCIFQINYKEAQGLEMADKYDEIIYSKYLPKQELTVIDRVESGKKEARTANIDCDFMKEIFENKMYKSPTKLAKYLSGYEHPKAGYETLIRVANEFVKMSSTVEDFENNLKIEYKSSIEKIFNKPEDLLDEYRYRWKGEAGNIDVLKCILNLLESKEESQKESNDKKIEEEYSTDNVLKKLSADQLSGLGKSIIPSSKKLSQKINEEFKFAKEKELQEYKTK